MGGVKVTPSVKVVRKETSMVQALSELQQKQIQEAEELLFSGPQKEGFAKELYFGRFQEKAVFPYPQLPAAERKIGDDAVASVRSFCDQHIDAAKIDVEALIPDSVVQGLGNIGVLGMTIDPKYGGRGLSQQNYCRVMEVIGGHCAATAVFVNAHHSIGLRALELFGTEDQKSKWMKPLAAGDKLAAFALTEVDAGSDASNVQTRATPTPDGKGYILNGGKRYITNGAIAGVLSVMARTPDPSSPDGKISCFLVTPDMPGFEVLEARMSKVGIKGTATARLAFREMYVPRENLLGSLGKGLRVALTVLDYGRITFGASCTGAAKFCVGKTLEHARNRRQFGKALGEFDQVKQKIAWMAAETFAMESATYHTAALLDSHAEDFMLETAMLKVFASDALWRIVNDTLQIYGGSGFFTDQPFERMMRDARLNLIGEGANDVLRSFIAMVGLRGVGLKMQELMKKPWRVFQVLSIPTPLIPVTHPRMQSAAIRLARQVKQFGRACQKALMTYRESILDKQLVQARLGDAATELFVSACVYARVSGMVQKGAVVTEEAEKQIQTGLYYLQLAESRNMQRFRELRSPGLDVETTKLSDVWMSGK